MPETEAKPKRLADIINVIGANVTRGITVPKVAPQIPFTEPEIKETEEIETKEKMFKEPSNLYELADILELPVTAKIYVKEGLGYKEIKPKTWSEVFSYVKQKEQSTKKSPFAELLAPIKFAPIRIIGDWIGDYEKFKSENIMGP